MVDLGNWADAYPDNPPNPIDQAWRSRLGPFGLREFPSGDIGPPNKPNPFDPGWQSRVPRPRMPAGPLTPQGGGPDVLYPSSGQPPAEWTRPGALASPRQMLGAPNAPGAAANVGPDIFPPTNSTIPPGKSLTPRSPSIWGPDATIDPSELQGQGGFPNLMGLLGGLGRRLPYFGYGALYSTPAETGELPLSLSGARPEHPHSTGAMPPPIYRPEDSPSFTAPNPPGAGMPHPSLTAPTPNTAPPPAGPQAQAAPRSRIDPAAVDLGYYRAGVGNARTPVFVPQTQAQAEGKAPPNPQAPAIFRGPLAAPGVKDAYYGT